MRTTLQITDDIEAVETISDNDTQEIIIYLLNENGDRRIIRRWVSESGNHMPFFKEDIKEFMEID